MNSVAQWHPTVAHYNLNCHHTATAKSNYAEFRDLGGMGCYWASPVTGLGFGYLIQKITNLIASL